MAFQVGKMGERHPRQKPKDTRENSQPTNSAHWRMKKVGHGGSVPTGGAADGNIRKKKKV